MKVHVVYAHPLEDSFVATVRNRVVAGLRRAGHEVDLADLYAEGFDPHLSADEWRAYVGRGGTRRPDIEEYAHRVRSADALVLVHPTWWSAQPAMLKGWFDRIFIPGVAFHRLPGGTVLRGGLRNIRRLVVVTTHGSSKFVNMVQGEGGMKIAKRSIRLLCHPFARTQWIAMYGVDTSTAEERAAFLDRVENRMARLR